MYKHFHNIHKRVRVISIQFQWNQNEAEGRLAPQTNDKHGVDFDRGGYPGRPCDLVRTDYFNPASPREPLWSATSLTRRSRTQVENEHYRISAVSKYQGNIRILNYFAGWGGGQGAAASSDEGHCVVPGGFVDVLLATGELRSWLWYLVWNVAFASPCGPLYNPYKKV